jgi:hypothetical protein
MSPADFRSVKQVYKQIKSRGFKFYCVGCSRERRQTMPATLGSPRFFMNIAITTAFCAMLTWPWLHFRGLFAFLIPVGLVMEALARMKLRGALVCPDCNFDPILYLSDRPKALQQVEVAWRTKFAEKNLPFPERRKGSKNSSRTPPSENLTSI